jgi:hypothetical protein
MAINIGEGQRIKFKVPDDLKMGRIRIIATPEGLPEIPRDVFVMLGKRDIVSLEIKKDNEPVREIVCNYRKAIKLDADVKFEGDDKGFNDFEIAWYLYKHGEVGRGKPITILGTGSSLSYSPNYPKEHFEGGSKLSIVALMKERSGDKWLKNNEGNVVGNKIDVLLALKPGIEIIKPMGQGPYNIRQFINGVNVRITNTGNESDYVVNLVSFFMNGGDEETLSILSRSGGGEIKAGLGEFNLHDFNFLEDKPAFIHIRATLMDNMDRIIEDEENKKPIQDYITLVVNKDEAEKISQRDHRDGRAIQVNIKRYGQLVNTQTLRYQVNDDVELECDVDIDRSILTELPEEFRIVWYIYKKEESGNFVPTVSFKGKPIGEGNALSFSSLTELVEKDEAKEFMLRVYLRHHEENKWLENDGNFAEQATANCAHGEVTLNIIEEKGIDESLLTVKVIKPEKGKQFKEGDVLGELDAEIVGADNERDYSIRWGLVSVGGDEGDKHREDIHIEQPELGFCRQVLDKVLVQDLAEREVYVVAQLFDSYGEALRNQEGHVIEGSRKIIFVKDEENTGPRIIIRSPPIRSKFFVGQRIRLKADIEGVSNKRNYEVRWYLRNQRGGGRRISDNDVLVEDDFGTNREEELTLRAVLWDKSNDSYYVDRTHGFSYIEASKTIKLGSNISLGIMNPRKGAVYFKGNRIRGLNATVGGTPDIGDYRIIWSISTKNTSQPEIARSKSDEEKDSQILNDRLRACNNARIIAELCELIDEELFTVKDYQGKPIKKEVRVILEERPKIRIISHSGEGPIEVSEGSSLPKFEAEVDYAKNKHKYSVEWGVFDSDESLNLINNELVKVSKLEKKGRKFVSVLESINLPEGLVQDNSRECILKARLVDKSKQRLVVDDSEEVLDVSRDNSVRDSRTIIIKKVSNEEVQQVKTRIEESSTIPDFHDAITEYLRKDNAD